MSQDLANLIAGQQSEGTIVDEGYFSLGVEEALRKVAQFGLESPEKGLLRIAQLSVLAGCKAIKIKLTRKSVAVFLEDLDPDEIGLSNLPEEMKLEANNFALALLASLHSGFQKGWIGEANSGWLFDKEGFRASEPPGFRPCSISIELEREGAKGFWNRLKSLLRRRCLDHHVLSKRLPYAPIEVLLDCKNLQTDNRPTRCLYEFFLIGPDVMKAESLSWPERRKCRYQMLGKSRDTLGRSWSTFEESTTGARLNLFDDDRSGTFSAKKSKGKGRLLAHLWIPLSQRGQCSVTFVKHGVVVGHVDPGYPFPIQGVVSAAALDTDLSGLELAENRKVKKMMDYLFAHLDKRLRGLARQEAPKKVRRWLRKFGYGVKAKKANESKATKTGSSSIPVPKPPGNVQRSAFDHRVGRNDGFKTQRRDLRNKGRY